MQIYMAASDAEKKDDGTRVAIIFHCAGPGIVEIYDQFTWGNDGDNKIEEYCNPRSNEVIKSHRFWCVPWREPFDMFLTELRNRADRCNFGAQRDRLISDKIIFSAQGKLQEQLLKEDKLELCKATQVCRAFEQSANHIKEIREGHNQATQIKVNRVTKATKTDTVNSGYSHYTYRPGRGNSQSQPGRKSVTTRTDKPQNCQQNVSDFCGGKHERNKYRCPAWGKTCDLCKGRNHFAKKCRKIHSVEQSKGDHSNDDSHDYWLSAVH